ncbi:MAG: hypothetical protein NT006_08135 [Candidatus Aminicenantes bacterium]|nr:hypothetical protein [Candidatus Aminicenantes bacterium]
MSWARPADALRGPWGPGLFDYRLVSAVLFLAMVGLYVFFG